MPYRSQAQLPAEPGSSHNPATAGEHRNRAKRRSIFPRNTFPDTLPQRFSLTATKHLEGAGRQEACREGSATGGDAGDTPPDLKYLRWTGREDGQATEPG